jgi:hypothetical protein
VGLHHAKEETMSKKPTLIAYSVREREGQKAVWTRIGTAWPHGNGPGFTIQLEALPIGDRIVRTEPKAEEAEAKA